MRILPVNHDIILVEVESQSQAIALNQSLTERPVPGIHEVVPASKSVLVRFHPSSINALELTREILDRDVSSPPEQSGELVRIPVRYDGDDLHEVAELTGLRVADVVARHSGALYTVAFTGFAPGFAYLVGGDPALDVPRRASPRTRIPAGAVGLAGMYTGVYPRSSPGGWQIIGSTELAMFDLGKNPPALLRPGMRVQFVQVGADGPGTVVRDSLRAGRPVPPATARTTGACDGHGGRTAGDVPAGAVSIEAPGLMSTLQDLGRPGHAALGVSPSGALDHGSVRRAARLVGNPSDSASIETFGGLRVRMIGEQVVAITGAQLSAVVVQHPEEADGAVADRRPVPLGRAFALDDGDVLELGFPSRGAVGYVSVRGGFAVEPVLGSLSSDILSGLCPRSLLKAGDVLPVGRVTNSAVAAHRAGDFDDFAAVLPAAGELTVFDVVIGPRSELFTPAAIQTLLGQEWAVTPESNRIGLRLRGSTALERRDGKEPESEGTACGALEVPPSGQPVLFMADHPVTGGYPVVASVVSGQLDMAGQMPIGARVRFREVEGVQ